MRLLLAVILILTAIARAQSPAELELKTERVVVFKDGYALFVKSGKATADPRGRVFTSKVPEAAILGSFWASEKSGRPVALRAEWIDTKHTEAAGRPCSSMAELLAANTGRIVTLEFDQARASRLTGTIREVLRDAQQVVFDESAGGRLILPVGSVYRLYAGASEEPLVTTTKDSREVVRRDKRLWLELGPAAAGNAASVTVMYFTSGVRWIPTYRLADLKIDNAELSLQGELLNEAEPFDSAAVDLVVGVPNFRFRDTVSPLTLEALLRNALREAAPNLMGQMAQVSFQNRAAERQERGRDDAGLPAAPGEITESGEQDLFVYSLGSFSLAKGARATAPLWTDRTPLRHLYTLDLDIVRGGSDGDDGLGLAGEDGRSPRRRLTQRVWHQLELANRSQRPWTTGAVLMMQALLPLGQELLTYTSPGGTVLVPMTVAVDMRAEHHEVETAREPNAMQWRGNSYARVTKAGTITITNHRKEPSTTRVRLRIGGKVEQAADSGRIEINDFRRADWGDYDYYWRLNNHSEATWDLTLKPGETRELTYTNWYHVR